MTPADFAAQIAKSHDLKPAEARRILAQVAQLIIESAQKGEEIKFSGLGTFKVKARPAGKKLVLTQSRQLKNALNASAA